MMMSSEAENGDIDVLRVNAHTSNKLDIAAHRHGTNKPNNNRKCLREPVLSTMGRWLLR